MSKTGVKLIKIPSYREAFDILYNSNPRSEYYLRNLVGEYIGEDEADNTDYQGLRHYWHVIRAVAKKINNSRNNISGLEKKIRKKHKQLQLNLF